MRSILNPMRWGGVLAVCLAARSGVVQAVCPPNDPNLRPVGFVTINVPGRGIDLTGRYRLGLHGERVPSRDEAPALVQRGNRVELEPIWQTQVDWSAYAPADPNEFYTRMVFDRQDDGSLRLCRMESVRPSSEDEEKPPAPAIERVMVFEYGEHGRLDRVVTHTHRDAAASAEWDTPRSFCYRYDAHGYPMARLSGIAGDCAAQPLSEGEALYVNADDGRLLRKLSDGVVYPDGQLVRVKYVDTYDAQGAPLHRYVDTRGEAARLSQLPSLDRGNTGRAMDELGIDDAIRIQIGLPHVPKKSRETWRFALIKSDYLTEGRYYVEEAVEEALGEGKADARGLIALKAAQERRIIERVHAYPGRVVLQVGRTRYFGLWPIVTDAQWMACADPMHNQPNDCP